MKPPEGILNPRYQMIQEPGTLDRVVSGITDQTDIAVHIETTGPDPFRDRISLVLLSPPGRSVVGIDWTVFDQRGKDCLSQFFQRSNRKILFNAKTGLKFFKMENIPLRGLLFDPMLARQLIASGEEGPVSLASLSRETLGVDLEKSFPAGQDGGSLERAFLEAAVQKVQFLLFLKETLSVFLKNMNLDAVADLEFGCIPAVADMELNGMRLDLDQWTALSGLIEQTRESAARQLNDQIRANLEGEAGEGEEPINLDSQPQMLAVLKKAGIPVRTTARRELLPLAGRFPLVRALIEYRKAAKSDQAFTGTLARFIHPMTGRIHPDYHQIGAATGRLSCRNPNLQQIPRGAAFRRCFVPAEGKKLIVGDYSQIELRVLAAITGDARMRGAFQEGRDLHRLTASLVLGKPEEAVEAMERQAAKAVNFGLIFAMGHRGLREYAQNTFGVAMTEPEAKLFRQRFFDAYPGVRDWQADLRTRPPTESRTLAGRRRAWGAAVRLTELCNTPVQGTAADIMKLALGTLAGRLSDTQERLIGSVHDEIILEVDQSQTEESAELLRETMQEAAESFLVGIPGKVDIVVTDSWATK